MISRQRYPPESLFHAAQNRFDGNISFVFQAVQMKNPKLITQIDVFGIFCKLFDDFFIYLVGNSFSQKSIVRFGRNKRKLRFNAV